MAYRFHRGMGGDQPGCGLLDGGVFKPQCWCLDHPALCSPDQYRAAVGWAYPGDVYVPLKTPPVPGAPADLIMVPISGDTAQTSVDDLLSAQMSAWQAQNAGTMGETAANIQAIDTSGAGFPNLFSGSGPFGLSWLVLAGIGAGAFALVTLASPGPRRYGR